MNLPQQSATGAVGLAEMLFRADHSGVFAVLDGASFPKLVPTLHEHKPEYCCLYPGELKPDLAAVAPYLVRLEAAKEFAEIILRDGWGAHWGIFLLSKSDLRPLRDHLRQFHKVELPDQRTVIFRYYDPRVLRIFLPVCNETELSLFFGPVQHFIIEGETPQSGTRFTFTGQALKSETFQLKKPA